MTRSAAGIPTDEEIIALVRVVKELDQAIGQALCAFEQQLSDVELKRAIMSSTLCKFAWHIAKASGVSKDAFLDQVSKHIDTTERHEAKDAQESVVH